MTFEDYLIRRAREEVAEEFRTDSPTPVAVACRVLALDTSIPILTPFPSIAEGENRQTPQ